MPSFNSVYHFLLTQLRYRNGSVKMGSRVIIVRPLLITPRHINFGSKVFIRNGARIEGVTSYQNEAFKPLIVIGDGVGIEQHLHLTCAGSIIIGANTAIAANVTISDIDHGYQDINVVPEHQPIKVYPVAIGQDCKIYNNAVLLPGTILGKHCIVGANSVVPGKTYQDFCVIVGAPAKVVKRYSFDKGQWLKTDPEGNFI